MCEDVNNDDTKRARDEMCRRLQATVVVNITKDDHAMIVSPYFAAIMVVGLRMLNNIFHSRSRMVPCQSGIGRKGFLIVIFYKAHEAKLTPMPKTIKSPWYVITQGHSLSSHVIDDPVYFYVDDFIFPLLSLIRLPY